MKELPLQSVRIKNFKAIRDSGALKFTPLTAFIGNNGSGKSSVVEALEMVYTLVERDLDAAMQVWRGIEQIRNHFSEPTSKSRGKKGVPISIQLRGVARGTSFFALTKINTGPGNNKLFFEDEEFRNRMFKRHRVRGQIKFKDSWTDGEFPPLLPDESLLKREIGPDIRRWQFLNFQPQSMGNPLPSKRTGGSVTLAKDGANVAEYLLKIRELNPERFEGLVETVQSILSYATDLQPAATSEIERNVYLQLTEGKFKIPGWLLSTGTLRLLALLAVFRHPEPPPIIFIEEIENGLDPRTIHLIVEELRRVTESGQSQVILTTHSPYLLDLLPLESIVLTERIDGEPRFSRPGEKKAIREWTKNFAPGQLYTMGRLQQKPR